MKETKLVGLVAVEFWQPVVKAASVQRLISYTEPFGLADGSVQLTRSDVASTLEKLADVGATGVVVNEAGLKLRVDEHPDVSVRTITTLAYTVFGVKPVTGYVPVGSPVPLAKTVPPAPPYRMDQEAMLEAPVIPETARLADVDVTLPTVNVPPQVRV